MNGAVSLAGAARVGGTKPASTEKAAATTGQDEDGAPSFAALLDGEAKPKPTKETKTTTTTAAAASQQGNGETEKAVPLAGAGSLSAAQTAPAGSEPAPSPKAAPQGDSKSPATAAVSAPASAATRRLAPGADPSRSIETADGARDQAAADPSGANATATEGEHPTEPTAPASALAATASAGDSAATTDQTDTNPTATSRLDRSEADSNRTDSDRAEAAPHAAAPAHSATASPGGASPGGASPTAAARTAASPTIATPTTATPAATAVPAVSSASLLSTASVTAVRAATPSSATSKADGTKGPAPSVFVPANTGLTAALSRPQKLGDGAYQVRAALDPPALGPVDATVKVDGTTVQVTLVAHTAAGHQELAGHIDDLRQALSQETGGQVEVTLTSGGDGESARSDAQPAPTTLPSPAADDDPGSVLVTVPLPSGSSSLHVIL